MNSTALESTSKPFRVPLEQFHYVDTKSKPRYQLLGKFWNLDRIEEGAQ